MKKYLKSSLIICLFLLIVLFMFSTPRIEENSNFSIDNRWTKLQNFTPISPPDGVDESFITYTEFRDTIANVEATSESILSDLSLSPEPGYKKIRFDTAEELYRFSIDVSFQDEFVYQTPNPLENVKLDSEVIDTLLDLDYVLGKDIDYSVMQSKRFIPIGYRFNSLIPGFSKDTNKAFTGSFDGRGFEIKNLYIAGIDALVIEEEVDNEVFLTSITSYYSMFAYNQGEIRNIGLVNPTLELLDEHPDLTKTANLVGLNEGVVDHVYVIDDHTTVMTSGIRMKAPTGATTSTYEASGIVFENTGDFSNAYYVSSNVVNGAYISGFNVQPVLFYNTGNISNLVYDGADDGGTEGIYKLILTVSSTTIEVTEPNQFAINEETAVLKSNSISGNWYYYPNDRYPTLLGLDFDIQENAYFIDNAIDLITFSKILSYNSVLNNITFREATYHLRYHIDMSQVAVDAYNTPEITFSGSLLGTRTSGHTYINYFSPNYMVDSTNYYIGMFSVLSGNIANITFAKANITIENSNSYFGRPFFVGVVTGILDDGNITNVSVDGNISYGGNTLGTLHVGLIAGSASGVVEEVYSEGQIGDTTDNDFDISLDVNPNYHIGGIIGSTSNNSLTFYNALNTATIYTISSDSEISANSAPKLYVGGVIGFVENGQNERHTLGLLTNDATIYSKELLSSYTVTQYMSGIIGYSSGYSYNLSENFGIFTNKGVLNFVNKGDNTVTSAGILVSNHIEETEFIHLFNELTATIQVTSFTDLKYTTLVYNLSSFGNILSQGENKASITLPGSYSFSGIYHSDQNAPSMIRFVKNSGNISYVDQTISNELTVAGFSRSTNINYLNVYFSGILTLKGITSTEQIWVSGITRVLSATKYIKNSLNDGEIFVAGISNTENNYIGGLVNINMAGDLDPTGDAQYPTATTGIINSINYAPILSTIDETYNKFTGIGNTFAGGIATFNHGSIQNVANVGDIIIDNNSDYVSSAVIFSNDATIASRLLRFRYGSVVGGITAAVLSQDSRIYDTANNGLIIAKSRNFARAGGVLASVIMEELYDVDGSTNGSYNVSLVTPTTLNINWNVNPSQNDVKQSILSNSINYGDVSSITENIILYKTDSYYPADSVHLYSSTINLYQTNLPNNYNDISYRYTTTEGTNERIGVHASAGGVIGYGLSVMRRMMNHGEISSTDVAGGIAGATFVGDTYTVSIDTAINYGNVKMIDYNLYDDIAFDNAYSSIQALFLDDDDSFIIPNDPMVRFFPTSKRGIGGIFGRLQRGQNKSMTSNGGIFDFIVNMNPNVDLIGRLDQVYRYGSSSRYFIFGTDSSYFSAKEKDTTQVVFTGYEYYYYSVRTRMYNVTETSKERYRYYESGGQWYRIIQELTEQKTEVKYVGTKRTVIGNTYTSATGSEDTFHTTVNSSQWNDIVGTETLISTDPGIQYSDTWNITPNRTETYVSGQDQTLSSGRSYLLGPRNVPHISENPNDVNFVYSPTFEMRENEDLQEYVYYVENGVLSDTFIDDRPNGMYVLSTSSGSSVGSVIPANINIAKIYPLDGNKPYTIDYESTENRDPNLLDPAVISAYFDLLQTRYNDKSALLVQGQDFRIEEIGGFESKLLNPTYDFENKEIIFNLHMDTIQNSVNPLVFKITHALLPQNALIAAKIEDYYYPNSVDYADYQEVLEGDASLGISTTAAPVLEINLNSYLLISTETEVLLGEFTSFSEAGVYNTAFMTGIYATTYTIYLNLIPKQSQQDNPYPYLYYIDGSLTGSNFSFVNNESTIPTVFDSSIRFSFRDQAQIIPVGTDITKYVSLTYDNGTQTEIVNPEHYNIIADLAAGGTYNTFGFTIQLNENMREGTYIVAMKYFFTDTMKDIYITKAESSGNNILNLSYNSSGSVVPNTNSFTSYINFGYEIDIDNVYFNLVTDTDPLLPIYFNNTTYEVSFLTDFQISPFAELTRVEYIETNYIGGYKQYVFEYDVIAEDGTPRPYIHYIQERQMSITSVYKNNNVVNKENVFTTREATQTNFAIDFGVDASVANAIYNTFDDNNNSFFAVTVTGESIDGAPYTSQEIVGLTYTADRYFNIIMGKETKSGVYEFTFIYSRDSQIITFSAPLVITKNKGVDAYLTNIHFTESQTEVAYPEIYVSDNSGNIVDPAPYFPDVWYAGIDYAGAKNNEYNFRIDGIVSRTPLNEYYPYFLDYLPAGAKISRKVYPIEGSEGWTPLVDQNSDPSLIAELATDFTLKPDTLQEPGENEYAIITYKVVSENEGQTVFYHITVTDIEYTVSLIFEFVYDHPTLGRIAIKDSELALKPIYLNVKNVNTNVLVTTTPLTHVEDFPSFNNITAINNSVHLLYLGSNSTYRYRLSRNLSGFFAIDVQMPKDSFGNDYTYNIEINYGQVGVQDDLLNDVTDYVSNVPGKYYYINGSTKNRTRRFTVIISSTTAINDPGWGLDDYFDTWR